jgi:hypothetical protein
MRPAAAEVAVAVRQVPAAGLATAAGSRHLVTLAQQRHFAERGRGLADGAERCHRGRDRGSGTGGRHLPAAHRLQGGPTRRWRAAAVLPAAGARQRRHGGADDARPLHGGARPPSGGGERRAPSTRRRRWSRSRRRRKTPTCGCPRPAATCRRWSHPGSARHGDAPTRWRRPSIRAGDRSAERMATVRAGCWRRPPEGRGAIAGRPEPVCGGGGRRPRSGLHVRRSPIPRSPRQRGLRLGPAG